MSKPVKLLDQMRQFIRLANYSYETEKSHIQWVKRFYQSKLDYLHDNPRRKGLVLHHSSLATQKRK